MLTALTVALLGVLGVILVVGGVRSRVLPTLSWRDLWTLEGTVDRAPYLAVGFGLMAVKYNLERIVAGTLYGRQWSILYQYLGLPSPYGDGVRPTGSDADLFRVMTLMSLPFLWTGLALTVRRLRSAGLPAFAAALFFVPYVNLLFLLVCAALPPAEGAGERPTPFLDRLIPRSQAGAAVSVVLLSGLIGWLAAFAATSPLVNRYGWALFMGAPFAMGLASALVHGHHHGADLRSALGVAVASVCFACLVLFAAAVEGVICLAMAAPLAFPLALLGALFGWLITRGRRPASHAAALSAVLLGLPALMGAESLAGERDAARPVSTSVDVDAPPARVWRNVVSFSELPPPSHPVFRFGFAYPVRATIEGSGVGAVRRCEFTTGAFIEPITVWDEPRRLAFDVAGQPPPMKESSWYPDLKPKHLEGFLVSEGGEFRLEELPGGRTRLTGTTWYRHEIAPSWYWRLWSDFVIHRIHGRVLAHVKTLSEKA